jgi:hypothetical protein
MRSIIFLLFLNIPVMLSAQDKQSEVYSGDTLVWSIYIGGKSDMSGRPYEEAIAQKWGIKLVYFFGDCAGTYDYKNEEFKESNQAVFNYLIENFGDDWYMKFNHEVTELRKETEK